MFFDMERSGILAGHYSVSVLTETKPVFAKDDLLAALRAHCGRVEPHDASSAGQGFAFADFPVPDATIPVSVLFSVSDSPHDEAAVGPSVEHSCNHWPAVSDVVARARYAASAIDVMGATLRLRNVYGCSTASRPPCAR